MAKRISKIDRETITRLVEKYSAQIVANAAMSVANAARTRAGRPANYAFNIGGVWAHVEYRRKSGANGRIKDACKSISKDLRVFTLGPHPALGTLRRMHHEARKWRANDASFRQWTDGQLANLEQAMAGKDRISFPMLLKKIPGGLESPVMTGRGRVGR